MIEGKELSWRRGRRRFERVRGLPGHCPPQAAGDRLDKIASTGITTVRTMRLVTKSMAQTKGSSARSGAGRKAAMTKLLKKYFIKQGKLLYILHNQR